MTKNKILKEVSKHGDAIVSYMDNSGRILSGLMTVDFSTKYIKKKKKYFFKLITEATNTNKLLMFNWTRNNFIMLDPEKVSTITPLAQVLKN